MSNVINTVTNDSPPITLVELLLQSSEPWKVHNCKVLKNECHQDGTLPLIYHHDRLSDELKRQHPLTGSLLLKFNQKMTASEACQLIGVADDAIISPLFIKITGSVVVFHEPLQLAIRLHWSNTTKQQDTLYCQNQQQAIEQSMQHWQFIGQVDTVYKADKNTMKNIIAGFDEQASDIEEASYLLPLSDSYQTLPNAISLNLQAHLHAQQDGLNWIQQVIFERVL